MRPLHPLLILALFFSMNISFAEENSTITSDSTLSIHVNDKDSIPAVEKKEAETANEKRNTSLKNSLTKREYTINNDKTSFKFSYGARVQTRYDLIQVQEPNAKAETKLYFRRVRVKSDGHLFTPKLGYKLEIDIIGAQILDVYLKWNFYKNFEIWAGQTKLRGNRERVISSQNLQFVDRSLLNAQFTLDRDIGFWLHHHFKAGNSVIREVVSVSKGEGKSLFKENPARVNDGLDYTGRLEYLPFGLFKKNGDYSDGDLEREPKPKLAVGLTYDFNQGAVKSNGHLGSVTDQQANLSSWIADLMFKYRGVSVLTEYVNRTVFDGKNLEEGLFLDLINNFYTGTAFNTQAGYLFKRNFELAARYTQVRPESVTINNNLTQYTLALSKYIIGHKIKAQTDFSFLKEQGKPVTHMYRLQFEVSF